MRQISAGGERGGVAVVESSGPFNISEELKKLPGKPGVYIMRDSAGEIIYIGKAVVLKNRVKQYFQSSKSHPPKVQAMVRRVARFDCIVTDSEFEAFILECNLIKKHSPRYNIKLKDNKHYPYIKVTLDEAFPRIFMTRRIEKDGARYFGPYLNVHSIFDTLAELRKIFPVKSCKKEFPRDMGKERPCLNHHLGVCAAPCAGSIGQRGYQELVRDICRFLSGRHEEIIAKLSSDMAAAAEDLRFEAAAKLRDKIAALRHIQERQNVFSTAQHDQDAVACCTDFPYLCISIFFIRGGKLTGCEHFMFEDTSPDEAPFILSEFLARFYTSTDFIPREIIVPMQLENSPFIEKFLTEKKGSKVSLIAPQRGDKLAVLKLAESNARIELENKKRRLGAEDSRIRAALAELTRLVRGAEGASGVEWDGELFHRIEAFDISNYGQDDKTASMVVFEDGRPAKSAYRRFKIKSVEGQDDYACMREALRRRFRSAAAAQAETGSAEAAATLDGASPAHIGAQAYAGQAEADVQAETGSAEAAETLDGASPAHIGAQAYAGQEDVAQNSAAQADAPQMGAVRPAKQRSASSGSFAALPELVLIDGGAAHLACAQEVLDELGLDIAAAGMAKDERHNTRALVVKGREIPLEAFPAAFGLTAAMQDEAHRFAVQYSRKLADKRISLSELDSIRGVGRKRKMALLVRFKSFQNIKNAEISELADVREIDLKTAERIYRHFHREGGTAETEGSGRNPQ